MPTIYIDQERLRQLRAECELHGVDYSRAKIEATATGGYVVRLPKPLVDLGEILVAPPSVDANNATYAEGELLAWMLKITRAERQRVRIGRVFGLSPDQISRMPLTDRELADYKAEISHAARVKKLVADLAAATEAATAKAAAVKGAADLAERYGLATTKPVQADAGTDVAVPAGTSPQVKNRKQRIKS